MEKPPEVSRFDLKKIKSKNFKIAERWGELTPPPRPMAGETSQAFLIIVVFKYF